ncbi:hypothetical protein JCM8547_004649 [Rhodosporidiobolus lusitaniae]
MASPRRVAVAIVLSFPSPSPPSLSTSSSPPPEPSFLLVSSRKKPSYVFPKGGIEAGESAAEAAEREAWEEAGLALGSAQHLAHLLTLYDPSPHILSPTSDIHSPSFVPSCEYSFELFLLPPPPPSSSSSAAPSSPVGAPIDVANPTPSSSSSSSSSTAHDRLPAPPPHPSLPPDWPESTERHRAHIEGWQALEEAACWGRREGVMREAIKVAREWWESWEARGRVEEEVEEDGEEEDGRREEEEEEEEEGGKGRL